MEQHTTNTRSAEKRKLIGIVTSDKMMKTITVRVDRSVRHPKYGKIYKVSKKYKAHDEHGKAKIGDTVEIAEIRPLARDKKWLYLRTVKSAVR
jgi:small subunit ribosomal protein S17